MQKDILTGLIFILTTSLSLYSVSKETKSSR